MNWLISPTSDISWLLGSVLVSYAMFWAFLSGTLSAMQLGIIWVFAFHGPHFWGTLSRTYLDREQYRKRRRLFRGALWWFAVGPVIVGIGILLQQLSPATADGGGRNDLIRLFFFLAAVWAYHHVAKQHFGFLALYRAKHAEFNKKDFLFHKYYLLVSLWMPALIMMTNHVYWLQDLPGAYTYVKATGDAGLRVVMTTQEFFRVTCTWVFWSAQAVYAGSLILRLIRGQGINLPLVILILCCVPLTWCVIMTSLESELEGAHFVFVPILTTYHNLQYHGLIWHYNRFKYRVTAEDSERRSRHGLAIPLNSNILVYGLFGLIYTAATIGFEHYNLDTTFGGTAWAPAMFAAFFWGFAFHHYYVDSKIWKASEDADLRAVLGFHKPSSKAPSQGPISNPQQQSGNSTA